jgi:hypothetical protein
VRGKAFVFAVLVAFGGCASRDELNQVVIEGRALLREPRSGDPTWEANRAIYLQDADRVAPRATVDAVTSRS